VLLLNDCLLLFISLSTQSGNFWIHPRILEDHIKMDLKEVGCENVDLIQVFHHSVQWRALVSTVKNIRVP
jgi:hypothetical protein